MSEAARRERAVKRQWALPDSRHDRVVRFMQIGLPIIGVLVIIALLFAPLSKEGEVSFILEPDDVDQAEERMRVERARYTGEDNRGRPFTIVANRAVQETSAVPIVEIRGMAARLDMEEGPLTILAPHGRYAIEDKQVFIDGAVTLEGPEGAMLEVNDVLVDIGERRLESDGAVSGRMRLGSFTAGKLSADLASRTITLSEGARLKIEQGAVR
ncbi:LPS export ABC transporter periplasmic protein LptC [Sphingomicrobium clamense]|uniref:LPS export ABC transporter periplasmic protein LptC n=1 Tax=Sphingomicrobium clamense TaxID=2851013 RepID=A0ABS6V2S4_9SPHN|nr:LPS export ABC transporter periplasmic protein LptC [Sphingomicrobium sp. B8]MBW0143862.1 LPS export ABC transporter periplasmic protein LptC [Sphingomicrobium sp. B8]